MKNNRRSDEILVNFENYAADREEAWLFGDDGDEELHIEVTLEDDGEEEE